MPVRKRFVTSKRRVRGVIPYHTTAACLTYCKRMGVPLDAVSSCRSIINAICKQPCVRTATASLSGCQGADYHGISSQL